jgi:hypothetical protein
MSRPVIQLHTIDQWMQHNEQTRTLVLRNIKLKDRLYRYLYAMNAFGDAARVQDEIVMCSKCSGTGTITKEPRYNGLHPSAMGHPCLLKIFKEIVGTPAEDRTEPRLRLIFDLGHSVHHMFQTYGMNGAWGPSYRREVEINADHQAIAQELLLEGHADAENILVIDDIEGAPIFEVGLVHEYKSINDNNFKKLTGPKPEHKQQANLYAAALNRPVVVYMYLNKNDCNISDFPVQFDPNVWAKLREKALVLRGYYDRWESDKTTAPPTGSVGFHCRDCAYMKTCDDYRQAQPGGKAKNG